MQISLQIPDLIQLLPFSDTFRKDILAVYPDKLSEDRRIVLERHLWQTYYAYFDLQYEKNLQKLVDESDDVLPEGYHDMLVQKTNKQIQEGHTTQQTNIEIDQLRTQLQQLVSSTK